jgi:hypothetical protein
VAGQDVSDDALLDGEGLGDTAVGERAHDWCGHAEIGEGLLGQRELLWGRPPGAADDSGV